METMSDRAALEQELHELDGERATLDRRLQRAIDQGRYARSPEERALAQTDEADCLKAMDRLMTRIRALEGKLLLLRQNVDPAARWWTGRPHNSTLN